MRADVIHSLTLGRLGHDVTRDLSDCRTLPHVATSAACPIWSSFVADALAEVRARQERDTIALQALASDGGLLMQREDVRRG